MTCQSVISFQRRKFQKHEYKIDQSIEFSQSTTYLVGELDNNELHYCLLKYQSIQILLKIPFLEFKRVFRSQCNGRNCWGGGGGREWECEYLCGINVGAKKQAARACGAKVNKRIWRRQIFGGG